jgi:hypothetical protein
MADEDEQRPEDKNPDLEKSLRRGGLDTKKKQKREPIYQKVGKSKIPVSKHTGKVWQSRKDQALAKRKNDGLDEAWDEALRYYGNDQSGNRSEGNASTSGNTSSSRRLNNIWSETENIVFANTNALVPALYAKNPKAEFTPNDEGEADADLSKRVEKLVNTVGNRKTAPGINLKPKAKRAVVNCALTNLAYIEVGYTFKTESNEQALEDLQAISEKLEKAKSTEELLAAEAELMALEEKVDVLRSEGPWAKFRRPQDVLRDCAGEEDDLTDSNWIMIGDFLPTRYIQAVYGEQDDQGDYKSVYKPTHVLNVGTGDSTSAIDDTNNFKLIDDEAGMNGYKDRNAYERASYTRVWYVWDKTTRRVLLFNDGA